MPQSATQDTALDTAKTLAAKLITSNFTTEVIEYLSKDTEVFDQLCRDGRFEPTLRALALKAFLRDTGQWLIPHCESITGPGSTLPVRGARYRALVSDTFKTLPRTALYSMRIFTIDRSRRSISSSNTSDNETLVQFCNAFIEAASKFRTEQQHEVKELREKFKTSHVIHEIEIATDDERGASAKQALTESGYVDLLELTSITTDQLPQNCGVSYEAARDIAGFAEEHGLKIAPSYHHSSGWTDF